MGMKTSILITGSGDTGRSCDLGVEVGGDFREFNGKHLLSHAQLSQNIPYKPV